MIALALGAIERGLHRWRSAGVGPGTGACWIWAHDVIPRRLAELPEPVAFFAMGFVELEAPPMSARLDIVADEGYHLFVNGTWVGANTYRDGEPMDAYEVGEYLQAGWNRVVVELRSRRAAGGLLASMHLEGREAPVLVTDERWQIHRAYRPAILDPAWPLIGGEPPLVWHEPPTGRWRLATPPRARPVLYGPGEAARSLLPVAARLVGHGAWSPIRAGRANLPQRIVGRRVIYDWGRPVLGFPFLDLREAAHGPAVIAVSDAPEGLTKAPVEIVAPVPGSMYWHASRPQRFRYLSVIGLRLRRPPSVVSLGPALGARLMPPELVLDGPFGLEPPVSTTRAEEAVLAKIAAAGW